MHFIVTINPDVVPDLGKTFELAVNEQIETKVLDNQKEAYIRGEESTESRHFGFFGLNVTDDYAHVHGYLSEGVAFSWDHSAVTFCTPDEYKKKHSCLS